MRASACALSRLSTSALTPTPPLSHSVPHAHTNNKKQQYPDEDNCTVLSSATSENDTVSSLLDSQTNASDALGSAGSPETALPISTFLADVVCKQRTPFQAWESECASWNFVSDNNTYVGANCLGHDGSVASSMNGSGVRELDSSVTSTIVGKF